MAAADTLGPLNVLVNNAAIPRLNTIAETALLRWLIACWAARLLGEASPILLGGPPQGIGVRRLPLPA